MLDFETFSEAPTALGHVAVIGQGVRVMFDAGSKMSCTIRRSVYLEAFASDQPTLLIAGQNRAPEDWFGLEIDVPPGAKEIAVSLRNYPAHRLFPRIHYERNDTTTHIDLPDVAAADTFSTRVFPAHQWDSHRDFTERRARNPRLTVLIPSTPWFTLELREIAITTVDDA